MCPLKGLKGKNEKYPTIVSGKSNEEELTRQLKCLQTEQSSLESENSLLESEIQ
jgi:hypothetical protein